MKRKIIPICMILLLLVTFTAAADIDKLLDIGLGDVEVVEVEDIQLQEACLEGDLACLEQVPDLVGELEKVDCGGDHLCEQLYSNGEDEVLETNKVSEDIVIWDKPETKAEKPNFKEVKQENIEEQLKNSLEKEKRTPMPKRIGNFFKHTVGKAIGKLGEFTSFPSMPDIPNIPQFAEAQVTCTSFTYSSWSDCSQSGTKTRTVTSTSPEGCEGGNPITSESCTYIPLCTEADWSSSLSPTICPSSEQQTKTWEKIGQCEGGVSHTAIETVSCSYVAAESPINHIIEGTKVTIVYSGDSPFWINIRKDNNIGEEGGYILTKTNSNSFTYDLASFKNQDGTFYYSVNDGGFWSNVNSFSLVSINE